MNRYRVVLYYHTLGHANGSIILYIDAWSGVDALEMAKAKLKSNGRHTEIHDMEIMRLK